MKIFFFLMLATFLGFVPLYSLFDTKFDTQEEIEKFTYPRIKKSDSEAIRNISLTLSAYDGFCKAYGLKKFFSFENQIRDGKIKINLPGEQLTFLELEPIAYALKINSTVQYLDLSNNYLGDIGAKILSDMLAVNKTIKTIDLGWCYFSSSGIFNIQEAVKLRGEENPLNALHLAPLPQDLENLNFYLCACSDNKMKPMKKYINYFKVTPDSLRIPYVNENITNQINTNTEELVPLADVIKRTGTIRSVSILENLPEDENSFRFISSLGVNNSITNIYLKNQTMPDKNTANLFQSILQNNTVNSLRIENSRLDNAGMNLLTDLLAKNNSIRNFSYQNNRNSMESSLNLIKTLYYQNHSIQYLVLKDVFVDDDFYNNLLKKKFPEKK